MIEEQVEADSGTVARRGQTQKLRMGPAPETDVEEEEVDNKMEEGEEVIIIDIDWTFRPFILYRSWTLTMGLRTYY